MHNEQLDIDQERKAYEYENAQPTPTLELIKSNVVPQTQAKIEMLIKAVEDGVISGLEAFVVFKKLENLFKDAKVKIDEYAQNEADQYVEKTFTINGVQITKKDGSARLQYNEDDICAKLSEQLKARQELVKLASKSKNPIYDSDGVEVPKVSTKFDKSSLILK